MGFGRLCCHFGRHALTRSRTLSTHLDALLYHLIVSCELFAVLPALLQRCLPFPLDGLPEARPLRVAAIRVGDEPQVDRMRRLCRGAGAEGLSTAVLLIAGLASLRWQAGLMGRGPELAPALTVRCAGQPRAWRHSLPTGGRV